MIINFFQSIYDPQQMPLQFEAESFDRMLQDIDFFSIGPQVYYLLMQQGKLEAVPPMLQKHLKMQFNKALYQNIYIKHEINQIFHRFEDSGISVIPLKGVRFSEKYFGHIGARSTTDIDLLIKPSDMGKAVDCIRTLGFTMEAPPIPSHFHASFAKPLPSSPNPLTVELHWNLLTDNTSDFDIAPFWDEATPLQPYRYVKELSDYHTFYMICLHGWKHALNSLKYFIDIIQLIHTVGGSIDYSRLLDDAAAHRTHKRLLNTLSIVYREFPHLDTVKPLPLRKHSELWWNYDSIRDKDSKSIMNYIRLARYQWLDYDTLKHSLVSSFQYIRSLKR